MSLAERLAGLRAEIARAAIAAGRAPDSVTLIAVSKRQPIAAVEEAYALGVRDFGENYAQELLEKARALPKDVRWHFIGRFQKNKINMLADTVAAWHTLSGIDDARALARRVSTPCDALLQVNVGDEAQKGGIAVAAVPEVVALVHGELAATLRLRGLMCIPPQGDAEPWFTRMAALTERVRGELLAPVWLSMGMSDDFKQAIAHSATHVRIGTALFGPRAT